VIELPPELLAELRTEVFDGGTVPEDLARLWAAQEAEQTDLLDAFELVLFIGLTPEEIIEPFRTDEGSDQAAVSALYRLLGEITWIAEALDGLLLGYWSPDGTDQHRVVVSLDATGQLTVHGRTFVDALISLTDPEDPDEAVEVIGALTELGIASPRTSVAAALSDVESIPDPNEVVLGYLVEARMRSATAGP
jgi:hypothetical protein